MQREAEYSSLLSHLFLCKLKESITILSEVINFQNEHIVLNRNANQMMSEYFRELINLNFNASFPPLIHIFLTLSLSICHMIEVNCYKMDDFTVL